MLQNEETEEAKTLNNVSDRTIDTIALAQATYESKATKETVNPSNERPSGSAPVGEFDPDRQEEEDIVCSRPPILTRVLTLAFDIVRTKKTRSFVLA
ncbi:hypothetical protein LZ31DRAFT_591027 [Colletotrichum somersetense]|nr:hypothetical protein LZ31DRAFT_591027 [Colletotrichum somersetense]